MTLALLLFLAGAATPLPIPVSPPLRLATAAFGGRVDIEVRDLPPEAARRAVDAAFAEVADVERLLSPAASPGQPAGGLAALNAAAGGGLQPVDPRLLSLLTRTLEFCHWSEGAHGPLGRDLYQLWGARAPVTAAPEPERLGKALTLATCDRLAVNVKTGKASLGLGAGLDLRGYAEGFAIDRAVEALRSNGVENGFVQIGSVRRGFGPGPQGKVPGTTQGKGWPVLLPPFPDLDSPIGRVFLKDQALAVASPAESPLRVGSEVLFPYLNHRTGLPVEGLDGIITVATLAVDAQGLSAALATTGPREGRLRLGSLQPQPSVLWLLGSGSGAPVLVDHHWSALAKR